jgi:hypothetical protein
MHQVFPYRLQNLIAIFECHISGIHCLVNKLGFLFLSCNLIHFLHNDLWNICRKYVLVSCIIHLFWKFGVSTSHHQNGGFLGNFQLTIKEKLEFWILNVPIEMTFMFAVTLIPEIRLSIFFPREYSRWLFWWLLSLRLNWLLYWGIFIIFILFPLP